MKNFKEDDLAFFDLTKVPPTQAEIADRRTILEKELSRLKCKERLLKFSTAFFVLAVYLVFGAYLTSFSWSRSAIETVNGVFTLLSCWGLIYLFLRWSNPTDKTAILLEELNALSWGHAEDIIEWCQKENDIVRKYQNAVANQGRIIIEGEYSVMRDNYLELLRKPISGRNSI